MQWVPKALTKPMRCAVLPQIGPNHPDGYIDTGSELPGRGDRWDDHVYVSVVALREMLKVVDWPLPEEHEALERRVAELEDKLAMVEAERDRYEAVIDGIDAIESADFRARKKTGRPKAETRKAAA